MSIKLTAGEEQKTIPVKLGGGDGYTTTISHCHVRGESTNEFGFIDSHVCVGNTLVFTNRPDVARRIEQLLSDIDAGK